MEEEEVQSASNTIVGDTIVHGGILMPDVDMTAKYDRGEALRLAAEIYKGTGVSAHAVLSCARQLHEWLIKGNDNG